MVVVNVSGLVKLLLELGVLAVRLNTTGVEGSLVNTVGNHWKVLAGQNNDTIMIFVQMRKCHDEET